MICPHHLHPFVLGFVVMDPGLVRGDDTGQKCAVTFNLTKKRHGG